MWAVLSLSLAAAAQVPAVSGRPVDVSFREEAERLGAALLGDPPGSAGRAFGLRAIELHLRDSRSCLPSPAAVLGTSPGGTGFRAGGSIFYMSALPGEYSYDFEPRAGGAVEIALRVHFSDLDGAPVSPAELRIMEGKFERAQAIWNDARPAGSRFAFKFSVAPRREQAHFSVRLVRGQVRATYFWRWPLFIGETSIAHELGHMLGLNDEYKIVSSDSSVCDAASLMCRSSEGAPLPYHYYMIFRRAWCPPPSLPA